jgi:hypothetical protein
MASDEVVLAPPDESPQARYFVYAQRAGQDQIGDRTGRDTERQHDGVLERWRELDPLEKHLPQKDDHDSHDRRREGDSP